MKVLLTSVFGPYGVDDAYGRKENIMELFHNQVTREQGLFSLRFQRLPAPRRATFFQLLVFSSLLLPVFFAVSVPLCS